MNYSVLLIGLFVIFIISSAGCSQPVSDSQHNQSPTGTPAVQTVKKGPSMTDVPVKKTTVSLKDNVTATIPKSTSPVVTEPVQKPVTNITPTQSPVIKVTPVLTVKSCGLTARDEGLAAISDEPVFLWWFKSQVDSEGSTQMAPVSRLTDYVNSHTADESDFPATVTTRIDAVLASDPTNNLTSCGLRNATKDYITYLQNVKKVQLPVLKNKDHAIRAEYWAGVTESKDIGNETRKLYEKFVTIKGYAIE